MKNYEIEVEAPTVQYLIDALNKCPNKGAFCNANIIDGNSVRSIDVTLYENKEERLVKLSPRGKKVHRLYDTVSLLG